MSSPRPSSVEAIQDLPTDPQSDFDLRATSPHEPISPTSTSSPSTSTSTSLSTSLIPPTSNPVPRPRTLFTLDKFQRKSRAKRKFQEVVHDNEEFELDLEEEPNVLRSDTMREGEGDGWVMGKERWTEDMIKKMDGKKLNELEDDFGESLSGIGDDDGGPKGLIWMLIWYVRR
jgi:hypothetical protein